MNQILLEKFPLIVRTMDCERLKGGNNELPSDLIKRVFGSSQQAQLGDAPLTARVLVKEKPNINYKDEIMTYVYAIESDDRVKQATRRRERVNQVDELIECKVCSKKHKKRNCMYCLATSDKLQLGRKVTFEGIDIEACRGVGDTRRTV